MKKFLKLFVLVTAAVIVGCGIKKSSFQDANLQRHTVGRIDLRDVVSQTGEVQPVVKVELKSESSGKIEKIFVKAGQALRKGDTILTIDPQRLLTMRRRNILLVRQAKLERELAMRDYMNAQKLIETGTISQKTIEDLRSKYEACDIQYQLRTLELKDVEEQLGKTVITAPMDGVLTQLLVKEGEIAVSATSGFSGGTAIGTIADISQLEVITQIGEADYVHLALAQNVTIKPEAVEGTSTKGTITFIAKSANRKQGEELGTFEVRVSVDSIIAGIAAGINVNIEFVIMEKKGVLGIPVNFVTKTPNGPMVNVVDRKTGKETVIQRKIELGATDYQNYEVLSGLNEGDVIVVEKQNRKGTAKTREQGGGPPRR